MNRLPISSNKQIFFLIKNFFSEQNGVSVLAASNEVTFLGDIRFELAVEADEFNQLFGLVVRATSESSLPLNIREKTGLPQLTHWDKKRRFLSIVLQCDWKYLDGVLNAFLCGLLNALNDEILKKAA